MRILVATDGSRGSAAAVKFAARLAAQDTELTLLLVGSDDGTRLGKTSNSTKATPPKAAEDRREQKILEDSRRELEKRGVQAKVLLVPARQPGAIPETICAQADKLKADLVVVGSEGRDTLSEWICGGVALRLIYLARRPVVVVRPPRRRKAR